MHRKVKLMKDKWDSMYLELLEECIESSTQSEVAAVLLQEGIANICLLRPATTKVCAKIEKVIPKKKHGGYFISLSLKKQCSYKYLSF